MLTIESELATCTDFFAARVLLNEFTSPSPRPVHQLHTNKLFNPIETRDLEVNQFNLLCHFLELKTVVRNPMTSGFRGLREDSKTLHKPPAQRSCITKGSYMSHLAVSLNVEGKSQGSVHKPHIVKGTERGPNETDSTQRNGPTARPRLLKMELPQARHSFPSQRRWKGKLGVGTRRFSEVHHSLLSSRNVELLDHSGE